MHLKIYRITNKVNGKAYIGQTRKSVQNRWALHCSPKSMCRKLKHAIAKYGRDAFSVEHILSCATQEDCDLLERALIAELGASSYNIMAGGIVNTKAVCKRGHSTPEGARDGQRRCKVCMREYYRLRAERNKDKLLELAKARYLRQKAANPDALRERARVNTARWRARKRAAKEAAHAD